MCDKILEEAGVSSIEKLLEQIDECRDQLKDFEIQGKGESALAQNLREELEIFVDCHAEYVDLQKKLSRQQDLEVHLQDLLVEADVDDYEALLNECERNQNAVDKGEGGESRLAELLRIRAEYEQVHTEHANQQITEVLSDCGVSSVDELRDRLRDKQSELRSLGASRRAKTVQQLVNTLSESADRIDAINAAVQARERASSESNARTEQCRLDEEAAAAAAAVVGGVADVAPADPTVDDSLPFFIEIFHDVENCLCEQRRSLDARKLYDETIRQILIAFLSKASKDSDEWASAEAKVKTMNVAQRVRCNWRFCIEHNETNRFHPSKYFVDGMRNCGATICVPSKKADGADTELKKLMTQCRLDFAGRSRAALAKTVVVVLSADSDFANSITEMRVIGMPVILMYDPQQINATHRTSVESYFSLPIWEDILVSSSSRLLDRPPRVPVTINDDVAVHGDDDIDDDVEWCKDTAFVSALFDLATFIYKEADGANLHGSKMGLFYEEKPKAAKVIKSFPKKFQDFCARSEGSIVRDGTRNGGAGALSVNVSQLLRFFVMGKGGRLAASKMGDFYKMFSNAPVAAMAKAAVRGGGGPPGMARLTRGQMIWEPHKDETIGFGYLVCVDPEALAAELDPSRSATVALNWPQYNYIAKYKQELDSKLAATLRNVAVELRKDLVTKKGALLIKLTFDEKDGNGIGETAAEEVKGGDDLPPDIPKLVFTESFCERELDASVRFIGKYLHGLETCVGKVRINLHQPNFLGDEELQRLLKEHRVYCMFDKSGLEQTGAADEVVMRFPSNWAAAAAVPGGPRLKAPTTAEIKDRVMQHLVNERIDGLIDLCEIVLTPTMHAKLVLTPKAIREGQKIKLLENAPRNGVQFAATYVAAEYGDDLRDQRFTLIYPKESPEEALADETNNHAGKTAVLKRIRELSIDVTMLDVFPNSVIPDNNRSRPHDEWFFFSRKVWDFVDQESKNVAPGIIVHPAKNIEKSIVRLEGPDYLVKIAQQYLLQRTGGLLFKFVTISQQTRCSELIDVLKRAFSDILAERAAAADDVPTCNVAAGVPNAAYFWKKKGDNTTGVSLVALPERRQQWQAMVRTALNVVMTFRKITVNMTGHQPNVLNKYLREFPNMVFPYDKTTKMLTLAGTTESVEAAERYIRQSIEDENPVSRSVDCMDLIDGDLMCQFFKLDCMKNKLLDLRNTLAERFVGKDGRKRVSCEVTADSDRVAVLQVFGPQEVINDAAEVAKDGVVALAQDLKLCVMSDLKDWEVEWLQANAGDALESANDVVVGMHTASSASSNEDANVKCSCMIGDIEVLVVCCDFLQTGIVYGCDALVNSANSVLSHGSGIARAIADAAGPGMLAECGGRNVPVGRAITTGAYDLNIHGFVHIVHAVAPIMTQGTPDLRDGMQRAVKSALIEARVAGSKGVAIPGIGMGIFGWSVEEAAQAIVSAISEWAGPYGVSSPVSPLHQSECGLRRIVLFDKDSDCASGFVHALQALADSQTDVADASTFDTPMPVATVIAPLAAPDVPTHQWFWTVWKFEVQGKPENLVKTRTNEDGLMCCVIPYDYDQNVLIENAFARNESGLELIGDLNGIANGKKYAISFEHMSQTTIPYLNSYSVRPIYRVPVTDPVASLPLYKEHLAKYQADVERLQGISLGLLVVDDSCVHPAVVPRMPTDLYFGPFMKGNYQWHSRTSRPRNGIVLFGLPDSTQRVDAALRQCLADGMRSETLTLDLLRTTSMQFDLVLLELRAIVGRSFHVTIDGDPIAWEITVKGLGDLLVSRVVREVLHFEKEKLAKHLTVPLPTSWGYDDLDDSSRPTLEALDEGCDEYATAAACFLEKGFQAEIISIERVQNPPLYRLYHQKRKEIASRNGGEANEMLLKHGTCKTDPKKVWESGPLTNTYGFDFRYSSDNNFYGRGSYFTDDASYSNGYAHVHPDGYKQLFLAYVAVGSAEQKQASDQRNGLIMNPSPGFQSIRGPIKGSLQGIVVYELNQSYPAYLVSYRNN